MKSIELSDNELQLLRNFLDEEEFLFNYDGENEVTAKNLYSKLFNN